jgi:hypothetical protein
MINLALFGFVLTIGIILAQATPTWYNQTIDGIKRRKSLNTISDVSLRNILIQDTFGEWVKTDNYYISKTRNLCFEYKDGSIKVRKHFIEIVGGVQWCDVINYDFEMDYNKLFKLIYHTSDSYKVARREKSLEEIEIARRKINIEEIKNS